MAEVKAKGIHKVYPGDVKAVKDFNLTIHDKEFVVLVGPSGCGKSTALRMVAGLEDITEGDLYIDGQRINDLAPKDRDIAMVFQNYALYPHMTVFDNMAFGLKLRRFPKKEIASRVEEAADILGLTDYLKRRPRALSGGQRQRVAVGRAIVRHPKVFLFDEPLSNLDAKMRVQMRTELCQLHSRIQATMIYVTHDQVEAMTMGNRIVVMKDGEIQQADEPLTVYHKPANTFVAGFIGSPPMNLFDAHIEDGKILLQDEPVRVSEELAAKIRDAGLQKVTVGIRPQDFRLTEPSNGAYIKSKVDLIETLGAEAFVHAKLDGRTFVFQIDPMLKMQIGDNVGLTADEVKVNLYHPETGLAMR